VLTGTRQLGRLAEKQRRRFAKQPFPCQRSG
jgi:hypothetical protein